MLLIYKEKSDIFWKKLNEDRVVWNYKIVFPVSQKWTKPEKNNDF